MVYLVNSVERWLRVMVKVIMFGSNDGVSVHCDGYTVISMQGEIQHLVTWSEPAINHCQEHVRTPKVLMLLPRNLT